MNSLDNLWSENKSRLSLLIPKILTALQNVQDLPDNLDCPQTQNEVNSVNFYAHTLYNLFCDGMDASETMMLEPQVQKIYDDIQDEKGNTRDWYDETGHKRGDF